MQLALTDWEMDRDLSKRVLGMLALIMMAIIWLAVLDLRVQIKQANHQADVYAIRTGLAEYWVRQQVMHQSYRYTNLDGVNPIRLMVRLPENYLGELDKPPKSTVNAWYYDKHKKNLIHVFDQEFQIAYRVTAKKDARGNTGGWDLIEVKHHN